MIGNSPGQRIVPGSMGRPLPGYRVVLIDADGLEGDRARSRFRCVRARRSDARLSGRAWRGSCRSRATIIAPATSRRATPTATSPMIGRADDVFKSSDYRLSPFELESVLIEHRGDRRGRCRAGAGSDALHDRQGLCRACAGPCARTAPPRWRSSSTCASALAPYKLCAADRVPSNCPRRSRARSGGSNCATRENELAERGERAEAEFRIEDFPERS